jgi:hypothetical protein
MGMMSSGTARLARWFALVLLIYSAPLLLVYFIDWEEVSFETPAIVGSVVTSCISILAVVLDLLSPKPSQLRTITITIEDSTGRCARVVTRSNRRVNDVKHDVELLVTQTS